MSVTSDMLESADAAGFGQRFFELVQSEPTGGWVRYRDVYNRTVGELPANAFVQWLAGHPKRRTKVKHVLASAQTAFPDVQRRKDGDAQTSRVWYRARPPTFEIVTDARAVAKGFATWRKAMMLGGAWENGVWETPEGLLAVTLPLPSGRTLGRRVALGFDVDGWTWTLQINQPTNPKTHNVHAALARSPDGRPVLLRQGTLQRNRRNPAQITGQTFRDATGLTPVKVIHNGGPSPRTWYAVAWLDAPPEDIRRATVEFAERCEAARALGTAAMGTEDEERLDELYGREEDGGGHTVTGSTMDDREVPHIQGAVWRRLRRLLAARNIAMTKPRHRQGYEVDGLISGTPPILLEIKTSPSAAAMQTGIGQLVLYPALLPRLKGARRVLLTRGSPRAALADAIRETGVELHRYEVDIKGSRVVAVRFDGSFLTAVGLG